MTDATARHLEWRNFRSLIDSGVPAAQIVSGSPKVEVFVDPGGVRIGLRTPLQMDAVLQPSPISEIEFRTVESPTGPILEVATSAINLFAEFYAFLEDLADRIQLRGVPALIALTDTVANWKALLRPVDRLSDEQQLGLVGELLVLDRLIRALGVEAFSSWTGPLAEPHDFRVFEREIEVKTTGTRHRSHLISSLEQLTPSPQRDLYLLSIQLEPTGLGAGASLPELVAGLRAFFVADAARQEAFENALLVTWRYSDAQAHLYSQRLQLRAPAVLVRVDDHLPRISRELVDTVPNSHRIRDVQYRLDAEGLGIVDGTPGFVAVVPGEFNL